METSEAFQSFKYVTSPTCLRSVPTGMSMAIHVPVDAKRLGQFGKIDKNFAKDMVAGFAPLTIMIPSSLKKPGNTQH
jgi:hypothetical protein